MSIIIIIIIIIIDIVIDVGTPIIIAKAGDTLVSTIIGETLHKMMLRQLKLLHCYEVFQSCLKFLRQ